MRYELDANGYVKIVVWGCQTGNCAEYTGTVPEGYTDLTEWSEKAIINAYYINEQGNLTLDSNRIAELEAQIEQETIENQPVLYKDLYGTNNVLADQYQKLTVEDSVIEAKNVKKINPEVFITSISSSKIDIVTQGKQMLKNDAKTVIGKNLFNKNDTSKLLENLYFYAKDTIKAGNGLKMLYIPCKPNTTYTISKILSARFMVGYTNVLPAQGVLVVDGTGGNDKTALTTTTGADAKYLCVFYKHSSDTLTAEEIEDTIQIEEGSTATAYEPYFAIKKDIDGSITLNGTAECGKNICPTDVSDWVLGQWTTEGNTNTFQNRIRLKELIPCEPNTAYYVQSFLQGISFAIRTFKADGTFNKSIGAVYRGTKFTTDANSYYLAVTLYSESSTTEDLLALIESGEIKPFICLDSETDKTFEAYQYTKEYNICGGSNNTSSIFALKKDMDYYLDLGELECSMKYYDGTTRNIVYEGIDGVINLSDDSKEVTQVTLKIPTGVTFDNKVIYPMLNFGEFPYEYEEYKCKKLTVDLSDYIGTTINNIHIKEGQVYIRVNGEDKYLDKGNVNLYDGYNLVYPMQSSMIEMTYTINNLKLEGTKTKNNNFEILEDGSIVAHNGSFSGKITATEGEIGGFNLGVDKFTSDIVPLKDYTMDDLNKVAQYIRGEVTLTDEELESYDLNEDGIVNLKDMVLIQSLITTNVSTTEPGTLEINSKSPTKTLLIKDKDGNEIVNISLLGIKINGSGVGFDVDKVYPVGSIYMNINSDNPGDLFGGTWERIQGVFLLAGNDKYEEYKPGATGGSVTHSHGYGSLYAAIYNAGTSGHYYKTKTGVSFTANEQKKDTGAGATSTKACTEATQIYGNTGSANGMPPFLAVYVWKRTA